MASTTGVVPETPGRARDDDVPAFPAAPTELAAMEAERDEKRRLLDRAAEAAVEREPRAALAGGGSRPPEPAVERQPRTALPAGCSPADVPGLLQRYYWSEPAAEVLGHDPAELA